MVVMFLKYFILFYQMEQLKGKTPMPLMLDLNNNSRMELILTLFPSKRLQNLSLTTFRLTR